MSDEGNAPEDEISEFDKFELFVTKHSKRIIQVALGIVVLTAVIVGIGYLMDQADKKSMNAIASAKTEKELIAVIEAEKGHRGIIDARLRLVKLYLDEKKYDDVQKAFTAILTESDISPVIRQRINLDNASIEESKGKLDEAFKLFDAISSDATAGEGAKTEANFAKARILLAQSKKEDAVALLTPIAEDKESSWNEQARRILKRI